jgi:mannose-6-phosphate isomerase-like protein (cupin superfamily)
MEIEGKKTIVRRHDVIFIPPGISHSICNNRISDLTFIVVSAQLGHNDKKASRVA